MGVISITESQLKNVIKRVLKEYAGVDYTVVGYIKNSTVDYVNGDYYILVDTNKLQSRNTKEIIDSMLITRDKEGKESPVTGYLQSGLKDFVHLLPEYKNTFIEYAIFGLPTEEKINSSKELMSTINKKGDIAILKHNSNKKIEDGFIRIGMQANSYSASDFKSFSKARAYFWGTDYGKDISNNQTYQYTCEIPLTSIYPIDFDPENLGSIDNVIKNGYTAVAYYMGGEKEYGTVVVSFKSLPIINVRKMMDYGKVYDANWNLIN